MKIRYIILYVLLLVLPSLFIGLMASRWVRQEDARLRAMATATLEELAVVMAGHLDMLVDEIAGDLLDTLARIPEDDPEALYNLKTHHPLVRHVFDWVPDEPLRVPDPRWANHGEQAFIQRYDAFFSGRRPWPREDLSDQRQEPLPSPAAKGQIARREVVQRGRSVWREDRGFQESPESGWIPWFWERDLHLLGWIQSAGNGRVRGVELEHLAVYARFQPFFQQDTDQRVAFALYDHNTDRMMQTRDYDRWSADGTPVIVPVSALLPHWTLHAVSTPVNAAPSFALLASILTAILLLAILSGGALLVWQGHSHYRDAQRKTTFVSNVSHELRTPLTTIRMYAEMLRANRVREEKKRGEYLDVIATESHRLTRLVNNVLDFSRLEQQRRTYRKENLDLVDFLRTVVAAHEDRFTGTGMRLTVDTPDREVTVRSDRDALEQVLLNVLDNAAKYAATGGEVNLALEQGANGVVVRVSDRGPGIPREHAARVFNSFHRVDNSLTTRVPGAGLGLSIGRRLMRDLNGDLTYQPREGGGSVFELRLEQEYSHG